MSSFLWNWFFSIIFLNAKQFHSGATTAASLLTTAAALVVFFSYKCDSIEFLQTGIILYYITIFLSLVEAILLFCAFGRACCDNQGCGSRLNTFLTYVIQVKIFIDFNFFSIDCRHLIYMWEHTFCSMNILLDLSSFITSDCYCLHLHLWNSA